MALVYVGSKKDEYQRKQEVYCDTDDLSQENYHEYCKLLQAEKFYEAEKFLKENLFRE